MARRSRKRPPAKTVGSREPGASQSRFSRNKALTVAIALSAVLTALVAYYVVRVGMRDRIATSSSAGSASSPRRFIRGADDGYVNAGSCAACHQEIAAT